MQAMLCAMRLCVLDLLLAIPSAFAASGYSGSGSCWTPAGPGRGLQLLQQRDIVFTQLYGSGADGTRTLPVARAVTQAGTSMTIVAALPARICTWAVAYWQSGRLGNFTSGHTCTNGELGALHFEEMNVQPFGCTGQLFGADNAGCRIDGSFAVARS